VSGLFDEQLARERARERAKRQKAASDAQAATEAALAHRRQAAAGSKAASAARPLLPAVRDALEALRAFDAPHAPRWLRSNTGGPSQLYANVSRVYVQMRPLYISRFLGWEVSGPGVANSVNVDLSGKKYVLVRNERMSLESAADRGFYTWSWSHESIYADYSSGTEEVFIDSLFRKTVESIAKFLALHEHDASQGG
jgi:hypothetical protein